MDRYRAMMEEYPREPLRFLSKTREFYDWIADFHILMVEANPQDWTADFKILESLKKIRENLGMMEAQMEELTQLLRTQWLINLRKILESSKRKL